MEVSDELKPMDTEDEEVAGYSGNLSPSFVTPTKSYHEDDDDEDDDQFQLQLSPGEVQCNFIRLNYNILVIIMLQLGRNT